MSQMNEQFSKFQALRYQSTEDGRFTVLSIDGSSHKLGISLEGFPIFFVRTIPSTSTVHNIVREILSVEYNVSCKLLDDTGGSQDDIFCIITLHSLDLPLQSYFIEIFTMMLRRLQATPSNHELSVEVENIIAIFNSLTKPPKKKLQGLWAELLVIEQSSIPETMISAWHSVPSAKYDFTHGGDKIEVKSTSSEERRHRFSLDQLNPSPSSRLLIASAIVRESGPATDGLSIKELYNRIRERVTDINTQIRLFTVIAETVGSDIDKIEKVYYDYTSAVDSLEFYDYRDIPSISKNTITPLITEVRFTSNLSGLIDTRNAKSTFDMESSPLFRILK